jgi:hypothetical protein
LIIFDVLQEETRINSSLVRDLSELNCFTIHCSHFDIPKI